MLLSNMSKIEKVSLQLLKLRLSFATTPNVLLDPAAEPPSTEPREIEVVEALDVLLEVFLKGEGKKYNPNANYDFLASVFANVSTIPPGRDFLLATTSTDLEPPLTKLISFTEHPSTIRRGGVASSIKCVPDISSERSLTSSRNSAFNKAAHARLVAASADAAPIVGAIDLLPQMLLPLCGPEEFDIDVRPSPCSIQALSSPLPLCSVLIAL